MARATQADWRRWAIIKVLAERGESMTTRDLMNEIYEQGWAVLPTSGRLDSIHAACLTLTREHGMGGNKVRRIKTRPARWELTTLGWSFYHDFLADNPNITPEKSSEEREGALR